MTDLSDILSCDQLDAAVAQQQQYVSGLGWKVAQAAAETKAQGRKVKAAEDLYNEFDAKMKNEIAEAKAIFENTPKTLPSGGQVPKKNPDWQVNKDAYEKLTQRRESKLQELQTNIDSERITEQWAKEAEDKLSAELRRAQQDLQHLKDAAARCKTKQKSKLAGAVLIGAGIGFAILGWTFMSPKSSEPPQKASISQPAVSSDVKQADAVTAQPTTDAPKTATPAKKKLNIMNQPLGEDGPMKPAPKPVEPNKNESGGTGYDHRTTDEHASRDESHDTHVSTGDQSSVGNDSERHEPQGSDESSHDYSYEVEHQGDDTPRSENEERAPAE